MSLFSLFLLLPFLFFLFYFRRGKCTTCGDPSAFFVFLLFPLKMYLGVSFLCLFNAPSSFFLSCSYSRRLLGCPVSPPLIPICLFSLCPFFFFLSFSISFGQESASALQLSCRDSFLFLCLSSLSFFSSPFLLFVRQAASLCRAMRSLEFLSLSLLFFLLL